VGQAMLGHEAGEHSDRYPHWGAVCEGQAGAAAVAGRYGLRLGRVGASVGRGGPASAAHLSRPCNSADFCMGITSATAGRRDVLPAAGRAAGRALAGTELIHPSRSFQQCT
jgi:hypothetical protein